MPKSRRFRLLPTLAPMLFLATGCANSIGGASFGSSISVKSGYSVTRNLIYTPAGWPEKIPADLYQPRTPGVHPAILLVHGGGWTGADGRWQMEPIARQLAKRGYVVLNVTYRLAPKYHYPAPLEDLQQAVNWLREHAAQENIDSARIGAFGYSAGGYLAALSAYKTDPVDLKIRAVVAGGAPSNLAFYPGGDLVPQFLGGTQQEIPDVFRDASPVHYVNPASPPTFIYHASHDRLVPPEHAGAMIRALKTHSVPHETYWIERRGHIGAFLLPADAVNRAIDFLDRHLR